MDGWRADDPRPALEAFRRSCEVLLNRADDARLGRDPAFGQVADWRPVCAASEEVELESAVEARRFFERWFQPYRVGDRGEEEGLFTGYYEPLLDGSRTFGGRYVVPLYRVPDDLLSIDLGRFDPEFTGRRLLGRVTGDQVVPYFSRREIDAGALEGRELELLWVDDPIDKFFLQIQGSGRIRLDDGEMIRVGYAGQNGHAYRAIGRDLIEQGEVTREEMSMQAIRAWLEDHPDAALDLMGRNRAYVFFDEHRRLDPDAGPIGAQGVPLTEARSLAVDPSFLPLGAPVWLETRVPWPEGEAPFRRLMVAQDTG
ncbi:MAG: murein transglycosylase A, partial [Geminicoccaceae bacterium]|nr:murein transglycosylase A [Geminicoccaceae bacterium]